MTKAIDAAKLLALVLLCGLLCEALVYGRDMLTGQTPGQKLEAAAAGEVHGLRKDLLDRVDAQADALRADVMKKVGTLESIVDRRAGNVIDKVDAQLTAARGDAVQVADNAVEKADAQLDRANDTAEDGKDRLAEQAERLTESTDRLADSADRVTIPAAFTLTTFNQQFMICKDQPWCLQSRWSALSGEAMKTSDQFRLLTTYVKDGVRRYVHPTWKERLVDYSLAGAAAASKLP